MHNGKVQTHASNSQVVDCIVITFTFFLPQGQVLLQELDDGLSITEVVLFEVVNLLKGVLESTVSQLTCLSVVLHNFVVEY